MKELVDRRSKFSQRTSPSIPTLKKDILSEPQAQIKSPLDEIKKMDAEIIVENSIETKSPEIEVKVPEQTIKATMQRAVLSKEKRNIQLELIELKERITDRPIAIGAKVPDSIYQALKDECERLDLYMGDIVTLAIENITQRIKKI
jgi:anion-transporting  ArsA/GET3 family ATPase